MKKTFSFACFVWVVLCCASVSRGTPVQAQAARQNAVVPACTRDQFSLGMDDENGNFDGMSHSGTLLVLRNLGSNACRISTTPQIALYGKSGLLNVKFTLVRAGASKAASVIVAAGAELTSNLRWASGDVFDPGYCVQATSMRVTIAGKELGTELDNQLCGFKAKAIEAEMSPLATDPVYRPGKPDEPGS